MGITRCFDSSTRNYWKKLKTSRAFSTELHEIKDLRGLTFTEDLPFKIL